MADTKSVLGKLLSTHNPASHILGDHKSKDKLDYNTFYSVATKSYVKIPSSNITEKTMKGRRFAVGTYSANGKTYKAYKVLPKV